MKKRFDIMMIIVIVCLAVNWMACYMLVDANEEGKKMWIYKHLYMIVWFSGLIAFFLTIITRIIFNDNFEEYDDSTVKNIGEWQQRENENESSHG